MECIDPQPCTQGTMPLLVPLAHPYARAQSRRSSLDRKTFSRWAFLRVQVLLPNFHRSVLRFSFPPPVPFGPARAQDHATQVRCRTRPTALSHHLLHLANTIDASDPNVSQGRPRPWTRCYRGGPFPPPVGEVPRVESFFSRRWKWKWSARCVFGNKHGSGVAIRNVGIAWKQSNWRWNGQSSGWNPSFVVVGTYISSFGSKRLAHEDQARKASSPTSDFDTQSHTIKHLVASARCEDGTWYNTALWSE